MRRRSFRTPDRIQSLSQVNEKRSVDTNNQCDIKNGIPGQEGLKREFIHRARTGDKLPLILIVFGFSLVLTVAYLGCVLTLRYEGALIAFGILVSTIGATLVAWERNLQATYITYMWLATFVVIGSITGVSVIGTLIKP